MSKQAVLFYDPSNSSWAPKLRQLCADHGYRLRPVEEKDLDRTVGALAQGLQPSPDYTPGPGMPVAEPMIILCFLSESQLDRTLKSLRKAGVPLSCLKAVLTADNALWTFRELYEEMSKERTAISSGKGPIDHDEV